jgi:tetratricopeptide (TPR) repeat protein
VYKNDMNGLIKCMKSGWYSGKGFKAARNRRHEDALKYLELALKYSELKTDPVIYDSMAFSHYNMGNLVEAINYAEKSIKEYVEIENIDPKFPGRIKALQVLVIRIKSESNYTTNCSTGPANSARAGYLYVTPFPVNSDVDTTFVVVSFFKRACRQLLSGRVPDNILST